MVKNSPFVTSLFAATAFLFMGFSEAQDSSKPVESGLTESVEVNLTLIDAVVIDKKSGRTVSGLTKDDFEIVIGGKAIPPNTLDVSCAEGGLPDPKGWRRLPKEPIQSPVEEDARYIVFVVDYLHLEPFARVETLEAIEGAMRTYNTENEHLMVVALTPTPRIYKDTNNERLFTTDRQEITQSVNQMMKDITLSNGNFFHLKDDNWFKGIEVLLTVLEKAYTGPKAMVFFSNLKQMSQKRDHVAAFKQLAADAATARTSIFPVYVRGGSAACSSFG